MKPFAKGPAFRLPVSGQDHDRDLTSRPIPLLIRNIAVPASVGLFFHTMFNVADTFFAGRVSTQALAAAGAGRHYLKGILDSDRNQGP